MRCSNIGPRGARNWFRVLDSPRQLLSPNYPDFLGLREAKQVELRSARVPFGATRSAPGVVIGWVWRTGTSGGPARSVDYPPRLYSDGSASRRSPTAVSAPRPPAPIRARAHWSRSP